MDSDFQSQMKNILEKLGLGSLTQRFSNQKVTPDIVCMLSLYEFHELGVNTSSEIMALLVNGMHKIWLCDTSKNANRWRLREIRDTKRSPRKFS